MRATQTTGNFSFYDVVILGANYAGLMAALRLGRRKWRLRIALVNTRAQFLERQRLEEAIVAPVTPRIPSISALVAGAIIEFIWGSVASLDAEQRRIRITTDTQERDTAFDQAIYAVGSNVDVDNVPGAAEHAYRLDPGDGPRSAVALRSRLHQNADRPVRVLAVGGGPTGIEAAGEIKTTWPQAEMTMVSQRVCQRMLTCASGWHFVARPRQVLFRHRTPDILGEKGD